jgi:hypothetical protein
MTSPYGYGGALAWGEGRSLGVEFWPWLWRWLSGRQVVTAFCRLGLFPGQILSEMPGTTLERGNVVRSTSEPLHEIWGDYAHKVRKNVKRARSAGLVFEMDASDGDLDGFLDIYYGTLRRRAASQFYFFTRAFLERLLTALSGQFAFANVRTKGQLLASELVLISAENVYSFLGGTSEGHFELRPNDLLKHSVIEWAHSTGKKRFVLGGGADPSDGIFRYKLSFAPRGEVPFFSSRWVLDPLATRDLIDQHAHASVARGSPWSCRPSFFPPYRS